LSGFTIADTSINQSIDQPINQKIKSKANTWTLGAASKHNTAPITL